uniref:Uncharacterized protein n=1 Tax=viral metagenome TaxID=1070528 RepID=A0A6C0CNP5_9ZZZZ
MKILLFTSIVFVILAVNLLISCPTKEGFGINKKKKDTKEKKENKDEKPEDDYIFKEKNFTDDGNPSQKFLKNFKRQKIEFDDEMKFSFKSITPEIPNSEEEAKKMQRERDAKRKEQKELKKEAERQTEREVNRREKQARQFCISSIPKTIWRWITEPFREIYYWLVKKLGMKWIKECIKAKKFIFNKIWQIKKAIISGFWNVMIDIIMFPCRKLGIDKAYRPLWRAKVNVWNNITKPIKDILTWKLNKILRALRFIC